MNPLLIATDVDGTLIDDAERVPARVVEALERAVSSGAHVVLASGRPPRWILPIVEQLGFRPICVCANGAVVYDSDKDLIISSHQLRPDMIRSVARIAEEALEPYGGVHFAVERAGRSAFESTDQLFAVAPDYSHAWESAEYGVEDHKQLFSKSAVKLLIRNEHIESETIARVLKAKLSEDFVHITFSMSGGLVEVSAPGVTKAKGLEFVADYYGLDASDAIAFGDMPNDVEMLQWAGRSFAMGNGLDELKVLADETIATNNDGAIADVLSRWF